MVDLGVFLVDPDTPPQAGEVSRAGLVCGYTMSLHVQAQTHDTWVRQQQQQLVLGTRLRCHVSSLVRSEPSQAR